MNYHLASLGCAFGFAPSTHLSSMTGLHALRIAQRRLRPEVRTKLLSVSSARSDAALTPQAWRYVFHDEGTSENCRIVTVAAKASSEHRDTVEAFSSSRIGAAADLPVISQHKLLVDSDKALEKIRTGSKLKGVRAAEYRLHQGRGRGGEPFWEVHFFSENGAQLATFRVGAKTAAVKNVPVEN